LFEFTKKILEHAGEGAIVRKYESHYHHGRADLLVKYKVEDGSKSESRARSNI
jgi:ATP-dependent DNA ligase